MYNKNKHIHFVGIGGIGMSGIAKILKQQGYTISGCDADLSQDTITHLDEMGCIIHDGNNNSTCFNNHIDILVYIPMYEHTIPAISAEIKQARMKGITVVTRAQMLAELMRTKYSIAVTGSHGKTTTSALISHTLLEAGYDPTFVVGGYLKNINSNAYLGTGQFFVAEADESDRSFLQLNPTLNVITNIDIEHLETYKDLNDIKHTYMQFIKNIPFYGKTIMCIDDEHSRSLITKNAIPCLTYGINFPADIYARNIQLFPQYSHFTVYSKNNNTPLGNITLPIPGIHNIYNALAAITIALEIDISFEMIQQALATFYGVDRRFTYHGTTKNGAEIFDDYGHHPQEIQHMLAVAKKRAKNKLIIVFQPHRYTRTEKLWQDFIACFNNNNIVDHLIITDIYSAGEASIDNISSKRFVSELLSIKPSLSAFYVPFQEDFRSILQKIDQCAQQDDLILLLGAGKMNLIASLIKNNARSI